MTTKDDTSTNVSNPISSGTLRSDSSQSSSNHRETERKQNVSELMRKSRLLQSEINGLFEELKHLHSEVREDIDDFCHIGGDSSATINPVTRRE